MGELHLTLSLDCRERQRMARPFKRNARAFATPAFAPACYHTGCAKKIARNAWHRARPGTTAFSTCDQPPEEDLAGAAVEAAGGVIAVEEAGGFIAVEAGGGVIAAVLAGAAVVAGVAAPFSF
jgi:hypothetical protein